MINFKFLEVPNFQFSIFNFQFAPAAHCWRRRPDIGAVRRRLRRVYAGRGEPRPDRTCLSKNHNGNVRLSRSAGTILKRPACIARAVFINMRIENNAPGRHALRRLRSLLSIPACTICHLPSAIYHLFRGKRSYLPHDKLQDQPRVNGVDLAVAVHVGGKPCGVAHII